ncbi:MAG: aminoglycoside phosphotransferase [Gammaproteobacteria bacterium]|nr:aminoglycoside phosphotransferase [Gammaproteobacteria bacterium]
MSVFSAFSELSPVEQAARLHQLALAAVSLWPLDCVRIEAIKVRENAVYAVHTADSRRVVLRVHRLGYHSDEALRSELTWMQALAEHGIEVPRAIPSRAGKPFELIEFEGVPGPRQVDLFEWIEGRQLGSVEQGMSAQFQWIEQIYGTIGELAARMHNQSCSWQPPAEFERHSWCGEGLTGAAPLWGRFWELEALTTRQRALFEHLRARISRSLADFGTTSDRFGLIHADLVPENILVEGKRLRIIDFDDAGFGWHMFEIATSLYFIRRESFYEVAREALIAGYRRHRPLPDEHLRLLPMFLAARGTTYLGWVHTRKGEATARELTPQLIELAVAAADDYLGAA